MAQDRDKKTILIIDDDPTTRYLAQTVFPAEEAQVYSAADGEDGLRQLYARRPDLVILDVIMPGMDGWETLVHIRRLSDVPVLMLTGQAADADVVRGLECGADDYLAKPFNPKVLLARAQAALRRAPKIVMPAPVSNYADDYLTIDLAEHRVTVRRQPIRLTAKEFGILAYLLENAGRVLTTRQILEGVWGWAYQDDTDYVRVYMSHLRQKLEEEPRNPKYLLTEHGAGYRFQKQPPV